MATLLQPAPSTPHPAPRTQHPAPSTNDPRTIDLQFTRLPHAEGLPVPTRQTEGAAGYDIVSAVDLTFGPMERKLVPTGFCLAIPPGYECQIRPRPGLAS